MKLIDTHAHVNFFQMFNDRENLIEKAKNVGVKAIILPMTSIDTTKELIILSQTYPKFFFPLVGIHPQEINQSNLEENLTFFYKQIEQNNFVGIGEIGIDLFHDKSTIEAQKKAFSEMVDVAISKDLPISIHCRDAFAEVFKILSEKATGNLRGVFHCFSGGIEEAKKALSLNFKLGIGGVVTFKNAKLANVLKNFSLEDIVLETDAPYLAPEPFRGKPNDSSLLIHIADKLSDIFCVSAEKVGDITSSNAVKLFGINV